MKGGRFAPKVLLTVAIVTLVVSIVGLIGSILLNAFVFDKFDAYGEVPIPGAASLHLPAGQVNITLHTYAFGSPGGGGLPVPDLSVTIDPPPGVAQPEVVESLGGTTTVNNDIRRRVWVADIPAAGTYRVTTDGRVNAFIEPRLAFGHGSTLGWLPWVFAAMLAVSIVDFVLSIVWLLRRGAAPAPEFEPDFEPDFDMPTDLPADMPTDMPATQPADPYVPTDEAIRIEQIKHLAALRDSGALTQQEFEEEKRRVLDGR